MLIYTDPELLCPIFGMFLYIGFVYVLFGCYLIELDDLTSSDGCVNVLKQFQIYFPTTFDLNGVILFLLYFR